MRTGKFSTSSSSSRRIVPSIISSQRSPAQTERDGACCTPARRFGSQSTPSAIRSIHRIRTPRSSHLRRRKDGRLRRDGATATSCISSSTRTKSSPIGRWPAIRPRRPHVSDGDERQLHQSPSFDRRHHPVRLQAGTVMGIPRGIRGDAARRRRPSPRCSCQPPHDFGGGPFPCYTWSTMRDLLDAKHVRGSTTRSRRIAVGKAFQAISAVFNGPEWTTNISHPETKVLTDAERRAAERFLGGSAYPNSDHPGGSGDRRPVVGIPGRQRGR